MVPFVEAAFLLLEALDRGETIDAESKRPLPAIDGALEVFRKILRRALPRFSHLTFFPLFPARGIMGCLKLLASGNGGFLSAFFIGDFAGRNPRFCRQAAGGLGPGCPLIGREDRLRGNPPPGANSGPVAPRRKRDTKPSAGLSQGDAGDAVAFCNDQGGFLPDLFIEFLAVIDSPASVRGLSGVG